MPRIYLDNAATSWPKPEAVYVAVDRYLRESGAAAGRGGYEVAEEAGAMVRRTRAAVARLVVAASADRVIFTPGGTESLNLAIHGYVRPGDHVVTTVVEHNSVLRPLAWLRDHRDVRVTYAGCDSFGYVDPGQVAAAIESDTSLVVVTHASNVTGALQPIAEIGRVCREHEVALLVDAAQTLGHAPIDMRAMNIDLLAAPCHKGLLAPLGVGVLCLAEGVESRLQAVWQGGTGSRSESDQQPETLPDRYEAGNLNTPAIAGFEAALRWQVEQPPGKVATHIERLADRLAAGIRELPGAHVFAPADDRPRVGVVSATFAGYDPAELAMLLAQVVGVECRAGLHCAGRLHEALGTAATGRTLRFSPGAFNTVEEVDRVAECLRTILCGS